MNGFNNLNLYFFFHSIHWFSLRNRSFWV